MTSPVTLRANFAAALRLIPGLVALVGGDAARIIEYKEEENGDFLSTVAQLEPPCILLVHQATAWRTTQRSVWQHDFELMCRPVGDPSGIFERVINGVPTDDTQPMLLREPHPNYHSMQVPTWQRNSIPVAENKSFDYWSLKFSFPNKGGIDA